MEFYFHFWTLATLFLQRAWLTSQGMLPPFRAYRGWSNNTCHPWNKREARQPSSCPQVISSVGLACCTAVRFFFFASFLPLVMRKKKCLVATGAFIIRVNTTQLHSTPFLWRLKIGSQSQWCNWYAGIFIYFSCSSLGATWGAGYEQGRFIHTKIRSQWLTMYIRSRILLQENLQGAQKKKLFSWKFGCCEFGKQQIKPGRKCQSFAFK